MQETTDPALSPEQAEEFEVQIKDNNCGFCQTRLEKVPISYYLHSAGWKIKGLTTGLFWLYKICPGCGYQWALWKLGVPR